MIGKSVKLLSQEKIRRNLCLQNKDIRSGILIQLLQASKLVCFHFLDTDRRPELPGRRQKTSFLWIQPVACTATFPQELSSPRSDAGQYAEHWAPGMFAWQLRHAIFKVFWVLWIRVSGCSSAWPQLLSFPATASPEPRYQVCAINPTNLPLAQRVFVSERVYLSAKVPVREATSEAAWIS